VVPSSSGTVLTAAAAGCSVEAVAGSGEAGARANFRALLAGIQSFAAMPDDADYLDSLSWSRRMIDDGHFVKGVLFSAVTVFVLPSRVTGNARRARARGVTEKLGASLGRS
jgi:hypothetical protein